MAKSLIASILRRRQFLFGICVGLAFAFSYSSFPSRHTFTRHPNGARFKSERVNPYVFALQKSLETLMPHRVSSSPFAEFRRVLIREKVGLKWNSIPEKYWEKDILPRLSQTVNIVDVGANIGQFAIPNGQIGHHVVSFEPNLSTCNVLKSRVAQHQLFEKVDVHCVAVGAKRGELLFEENALESTSFTAAARESSTPTVGIAVDRIDSMISHETSWFLFKTDTQGFEMDVLKGAEQILSSGKVFFLMVEFSYGLLKRAGTDPIDLLNYIYDIGYVCTYMAYHTRMASEPSKPLYQVVHYDPNQADRATSMSFEDFIESLRVVNTPGSAGVSGWTDLLCWKP